MGLNHWTSFKLSEVVRLAEDLVRRYAIANSFVGSPTLLAQYGKLDGPIYLKSVNQNLLSVPRCNSSFQQRSFSHCAPKIWNEIHVLLSVRQSHSLTILPITDHLATASAPLIRHSRHSALYKSS